MERPRHFVPRAYRSSGFGKLIGMPPAKQTKITIYYDGLCGLCSGTIRKIASSSQRQKFEYVDVASGNLPPGIDYSGAMRDVHAVDSTGQLYTGFDAVLKVLDEYPVAKILSRIGRLPGFHRTGRAIYRIVARARFISY